MKTAYLFPGQGSQFVGMGKDLCAAFAEARRVFAEANEILGFDLQTVCFEGPEEELRQTQNTQPAIFVHSAAVLAALGWSFEKDHVLMAGHSLGEYSAYFAAGALRFEDALRLVRRRGELMYRAGQERTGAMAAVLGLGATELEAVLAEVPGIVVPANFNSPSQIVISGEAQAVERASALLSERGAKRVVRLEVSGAFHSPLMESAARGLDEALAGIDIHSSVADVYANESAAPVPDAGGIAASLSRQLLSPVRWDATIRSMRQHGVERFVEIGPGKVLSGLVRSIDRDAQTVAIGTPEQIEQARGQEVRS